MAKAAIAAPPMRSSNFQSASKSFNEQTPRPQMRGIAQGPRNIACAARRDGYPHSPMPHCWVFYRNPRVYGKLRLRGVHRIAQHANTGNTDLDRVAGNERTYPGWRTGGDNVAGHQGHHAGDPADKKRGRIGHQRRDPGLSARAVDVSLDEHVGWVENSFDVRTDGAEGVESLGASELNITFLKVARGDIVEAGVTHHKGQSIVGIAQLRATAADD